MAVIALNPLNCFVKRTAYEIVEGDLINFPDPAKGALANLDG